MPTTARPHLEVVLRNGDRTTTGVVEVDTGWSGAFGLTEKIGRELGLSALGPASDKTTGWGDYIGKFVPTIIDEIAVSDSPGCVLRNVYGEFGGNEKFAKYREGFIGFIGDSFLRTLPKSYMHFSPDGKFHLTCGKKYNPPLISGWTLGGIAAGFVGAAIGIPYLLRKLKRPQ